MRQGPISLQSVETKLRLPVRIRSRISHATGEVTDLAHDPPNRRLLANVESRRINQEKAGDIAVT
jgi:hypothetical protein